MPGDNALSILKQSLEIQWTQRAGNLTAFGPDFRRLFCKIPQKKKGGKFLIFPKGFIFSHPNMQSIGIEQIISQNLLAMQ